MTLTRSRALTGLQVRVLLFLIPGRVVAVSSRYLKIPDHFTFLSAHTKFLKINFLNPRVQPCTSTKTGSKKRPRTVQKCFDFTLKRFYYFKFHDKYLHFATPVNSQNAVLLLLLNPSIYALSQFMSYFHLVTLEAASSGSV